MLGKKPLKDKLNSKLIEWYFEVPTPEELAQWMTVINETPQENPVLEENKGPVEEEKMSQIQEYITMKISQSTKKNPQNAFDQNNAAPLGLEAKLNSENPIAMSVPIIQKDNLPIKIEANKEMNTSTGNKNITNTESNNIKSIDTSKEPVKNINETQNPIKITESKINEIEINEYNPLEESVSKKTINIALPSYSAEKPKSNNNEAFLKSLYEPNTSSQVDWDSKFQELWTKLILSNKNFEESTKVSEMLMEIIGQFKRTAQFYTELIINQLIDQNVQSSTNKVPIEDEVILSNIKIQFASYEKTITYKSELGEKYTELAYKSYQREFLAFDVLFDALHILSKPESKVALRIPLCAFTYYKGYYALAKSIPSLEEEPTTLDTYFTKHVESLLKNVEEVLNIRGNNADPYIKCISPFIKIYKKVSQTRLKSVSMYQKNAGTTGMESDSDNIYYLTNVNEIFPIDYYYKNLKKEDSFLRPEFVNQHKTPISSYLLKQKLITLPKINEGTQNSLFIAQSTFMQEHTLPLLLSAIEAHTNFPIDSKGIKQIFHFYGVNMRYMGKLYQMTSLNHVKQILAVEMLARRLKEYLSISISEIVEGDAKIPTFAGNEPIKLASSFDSSQFTNSNYIIASNATKQKYNELLNSSANQLIVKHLLQSINVIFGDSQDSNQFWSIIAKQTVQYYLINQNQIEIFNKANINLNALAFALSYHMRIELNISDKHQINLVTNPFSSQDIKAVVSNCKSYGLRKIIYTTLSEKYNTFRDQGKSSLSLRSLKMKIKMNKLLNDSLDLEAIVATAEILLEENMIKEAIEKAQEGLCLVNPLHSSSVKLYCVLIRAFYSRNTDKASQTQGYNYFFKACQAIDFHLGKAHPLHSDVYKINAQINMSIYQNYPQADFLYESCETCLRKAYGVNHPKTADAYIDIGKLYIKMGRLEEALKFTEKSAKCYEKENMRAQLGAAHIVLAQIYQSLNMYDNALDYAYSASGIYDLLVAPQNYIFSLYLIISIASKAKKDDIVINEGNKLFGYIKLKYQAPSEMSAPLLSIQFKSAIVLFITVARSLEETLKKSIVAMITDIYSTLDDNNSISIVDLDNIQIIPAESTISDLCKIIIHNDIDACKTIAEVLISSQKVHFGLYGQPKKQLSGNANATKYEVLIKILKAVKPQELIEAISN